MSMISAMGSGYADPYKARPVDNSTGKISSSGYSLGDFFQDIGDGAAQAFGQPTTAERDAQATLKNQFDLLAEAYRQYRGLNADQQVNNLNAMLGTRAPVQQALSKMMPDIQPQNNDMLLNSLAWNASGIKDFAGVSGVTGGQGPVAAAAGGGGPWPVAIPAGAGAVAPRRQWDEPRAGFTTVLDPADIVGRAAHKR